MSIGLYGPGKSPGVISAKNIDKCINDSIITSMVVVHVAVFCRERRFTGV